MGTYYESFLDKERFIYFLEGSLIFTNGSSYCISSDRTSLEGIDDSTQYLIVYSVESAGIYLKFIESVLSYLNIYLSISHHLGEIAHTAEECIGNTRSTAASHGYLLSCLIVYIYFKDRGASLNYTLKILNIIVFQGAGNTKAGPEGSCKKTAAGGSSYKSEGIERYSDRAGSGAFIDHNIYNEILHCGIQIFLNFRRKTVDFIYKENISRLK